MLRQLRPRHLGWALAMIVGVLVINHYTPVLAWAAEEEAKAPEQQSYFWWFIESSGFIGGFILLLSIYFVSTVCRLFIELRPIVAAPPEIVDEVEDLLQKRQFKEIYAVVKDDPSYYSRLLSTGIAELPNGLSEARDAMERVAESLNVEMEKKISMLAVLGTLGPMIGLLGTLKGMIASFSVIAVSGAQLKADEVAERYFRSLAAHARGRGFVRAGYLLFRPVPQPRVIDLGFDHAAVR